MNQKKFRLVPKSGNAAETGQASSIEISGHERQQCLENRIGNRDLLVERVYFMGAESSKNNSLDERRYVIDRYWLNHEQANTRRRLERKPINHFLNVFFTPQDFVI
ncbi:hypothetical protein CEXT_74781 [Caerostris extrusa]|uniref:Uncharacterized protein n=1 Tax=Caerostris extrusa TaxID=172846 RepID=A0AAV4S556_CAEEX|nr:hypothetical protein CEXT_74781 [Caerostris extrusa]